MSEEFGAPSAKDAADDAAGDAAVRLAALEQKLAQVEAEARGRLVRAELKAEAVRAGMVDLDGLKLIDTDAVKLSDAGEVEGGAALMREMKRAKPWLFGPASSSSTAVAPPAQPPRQKSAREMSFDEWQAARAELLRRR
ncbi:MAG: hypothetical protein J0I21_16805 [Alphaproteobacteria bacterium]|nr:hypothetical protein [Alphaproteobacteria bacterium]